MTETISVPPLGPARPVPLPQWRERTLDTGLHVVGVRRSGVPVVEVRLRIPLAVATSSVRATADVMAETLLAGTARLDKFGLAAALQAMGASLGVSVDDDALRISGSTLTDRLPDVLSLLAEVLAGPAFPSDEVAGEAARLGQRIAIALSQAGVAAHEAIGARMYGDHPYGMGLPRPEVLTTVDSEQVRELFDGSVRAGGATLLMVGDADPDQLIAAVSDRLGGWLGAPSDDAALPPLPELPAGAPLLLVDRPGSVQSALRVGGVAPRRTDAAFPAFQLANMVFGGYFSSRLVTNLREEKGYTYSPHSALSHRVLGSRLLIEADVATEVTAPALAETRRELERMANEEVGAAELDDAREYTIGSLAVGTASHSGLASTLSALLASGVGVAYLARQPEALRQVTVADVAEQAALLLDPRRLVTVVVGDAAQVRESLSELGPLES